jgi:monoamine oxidase
VLNYCKELGVPLQMFVNEADASYFYYEGTAAGSLANRRIRLSEIKADMIGHTNELIVKAIDQRQLDLPLTDEDKQRFVNYLVAQGYLDSSNRVYKAFADRGSGDPYELGALLRAGFASRMRSIPARDGIAAAPMFHPVGGMDQFAKAFERAIGSNRIVFNAEVRSVHQTESGVSVEYVDMKTGTPKKTSADFVVVCVPLPVLSAIDIDLSPETLAVAKAVTYSNSAKMGLAMKRRFWEEDDQIFGGHLYSNLPLGDFSYPSSDYCSRKGVLLGLYINAGIGDLLDQPIKSRVEHVLHHASKVHPQIREEFESAYAVWWKKVKYNQGGFASGVSPARRAQLSKVENRLIIGSAVVAPASEPDWQEGAIAAAWQTLTSLHARAMPS